MLNPELKLNNIFESDEKKATRDGYGDGLLELGKTNPNVVVLTADLSESTRDEAFAKEFPERFFDCGVAEQNMAAVASGMGVSGKIPFISSYATFSPGKNWETIRTTIVYNRSNVKIAGHHAGIMTAQDGATHQATEDIALTRCLPDIQVIVPCDYFESYKSTIEASKIEGPVYLRFTREATPIITSKYTPFSIGKSYPFWISNNPKVTIFATGHILYYALLAAKEIESEGIETLVVNVPSIKPFNEKEIVEYIKNTHAAVSVEDHQIMGGLGGALSELFARTIPTPMEFIGLQDTFAESGKALELLEKYKMGKDSIKNAIRKVITRKI